jgi:MFS family permease
MTARLLRSEGLVALRHRGYRIYYYGMLARGIGAWMQLVAIPWLAVELEASPVELGIVTACLFASTIVIAPFGGVLADRVNRDRVLIASQLASLAHAAVLFALIATDTISIGLLVVFALLFGLLVAVELPVRQAFLTEFVPPEEVTSAVSLHATAWNVTRFVGPALAGVLIGTLGVASCFVVAGVASLATTASLVVLMGFGHHRRPRAAPVGGVVSSLMAGVRFALHERRVRWAMAILAAAGIFGIQSFQTLAPLYVADILELGGGAFGAFMSAWGAGALVAAFAVTLLARGDRTRWLIGGLVALAILLAGLSLTASVAAAYAIAALLGFAQIAVVQNSLVTVQFAATDEYRGRLMGLYTTVLQGSIPFGALLAGALAGVLGVSGAMLVGATGLALVAIGAAQAAPRSAASASARAD